ncbi:MAG: hypothetical protein ABI434_07730 [Burkholderiaceae bacterium]
MKCIDREILPEMVASSNQAALRCETLRLNCLHQPSKCLAGRPVQAVLAKSSHLQRVLKLMESIMRNVFRAMALIALISAGAAHAKLAGNGLETNGFRTNGIQANGLRTNGLELNGLRTNGIRTNGIRTNGVQTQHPADLPSLQQLASQPLAR